MIPIIDNKKITNKLFWKEQKIRLINNNESVNKLFLNNLKIQYFNQNRHCLNIQSLNKKKIVNWSLNDLKVH